MHQPTAIRSPLYVPDRGEGVFEIP
jgi:hypothetical protein